MLGLNNERFPFEDFSGRVDLRERATELSVKISKAVRGSSGLLLTLSPGWESTSHSMVQDGVDFLVGVIIDYENFKYGVTASSVPTFDPAEIFETAARTNYRRSEPSYPMRSLPDSEIESVANEVVMDVGSLLVDLARLSKNNYKTSEEVIRNLVERYRKIDAPYLNLHGEAHRDWMRTQGPPRLALVV